MSIQNWIAIRVDGSAQIGIGHVMRCLTLANAFARRGIECLFVCRRLDGSLPEWLREAGHGLINLVEDGPDPSPAQGGYGAWLGTTQAHDADGTLRALASRREQSGNPLLVLVDHYGLGREWEECISKEIGVSVAVIDDLDREHHCDFLIDTTYGKEPTRYRGRAPEHSVVMTGADYALLRPGFAELREETLARRDAAFAAGEPVKNLLIGMGGADPGNATAWVLKAIEPLATRYGFDTNVLVGGAYPHHDRLRELAASYTAPLTVHRDISDVAGLLADMDLCIGAAGSSSWERCCLGLPTVNVVLADNQREIAAALSGAGAVVDGGRIGEGTSLSMAEWAQQHVEPLLADNDKRKVISNAARMITDGRGTMKVLSRLFSGQVRAGPVQLRRADERDIALVYEWQCFPQTRRFAVNPNIPAWNEHQAWMKQKLRDLEAPFYIATAGGIAAGVVRLDPEIRRLPHSVVEHAGPDVKEVSIFTAPEFYGTGVAYGALLALQERHELDTIVAHVLQQNAASRALFAKAKFMPLNEEYFLWKRSESGFTEQDGA